MSEEEKKNNENGGTPPPAEKSGEGGKSVKEILLEMQKKHETEISALRAELEKEKAEHAADIRDILIGKENEKKKAEEEAKAEQERADVFAKAAARIARRLGGKTRKELKDNGD